MPAGVFPTIVENETNLSFSLNEPTTAQLFITDQNGQIVRSQKYHLLEGEQVLQLNNLGNLHNGTYHYQLLIGNEVATGKFVKAAKK